MKVFKLKITEHYYKESIGYDFVKAINSYTSPSHIDEDDKIHFEKIFISEELIRDQLNLFTQLKTKCIEKDISVDLSKAIFYRMYGKDNENYKKAIIEIPPSKNDDDENMLIYDELSQVNETIFFYHYFCIIIESIDILETVIKEGLDEALAR